MTLASVTMNPNPSLDHWPIIFLLGSAQGIFLFILFLFHKNWKNTSNKILATIVLLFSIMLLYYVAFWTNYLQFLPRVSGLIGWMTLLIGPLFYWYAVLLAKDRAPKHLWLHFAPFLFIAVIYALPILVAELGSDRNPVSFFYTGKVRGAFVIFQNLQLVVYTLMVWKTVSSAKKQKPWLSQISMAFSVFSVGFVLYYVLVWSSLLKIEYDYGISFAMAFFIYFIGYKGYLRPEIMRPSEQLPKYAKSLLSEAAAKALVDRIVQHIEDKEPYKSSDYKLQTLGADLEISTHIVSQVLNQHMQKSFSDLMNFYRIRDAKKMLENDDQIPIIAVAYAAGFNNKVSFNSSFKKIAGQTPGQFRSKLRETRQTLDAVPEIS